MLKSELVYWELFRRAKTQKEIADRLGISLSTVSHALEPLARIGAVAKRKFGLTLVDKEKALAYWASVRNLEKDLVYKTRVAFPITELERLMPSGVVFTAFTAFKLRFKDVPADYSEVYVYADAGEVAEIQKRFPPQGGPANLLVLSKPEKFSTAKIVPDELLFVDLWNLKEWYAREFLNALKQKMGVGQ